jgi:hypothetical protein
MYLGYRYEHKVLLDMVYYLSNQQFVARYDATIWERLTIVVFSWSVLTQQSVAKQQTDAAIILWSRFSLGRSAK